MKNPLTIIFLLVLGIFSLSLTVYITTLKTIGNVNAESNSNGNQVYLQKSGDQGTKLDIVAIPVNFTNISNFKEILQQVYFKGISNDHAGLFQTEPFSLYKQKFNISFINKNLDESKFNCVTEIQPNPPPGRPSEWFTCDGAKIFDAYKAYKPDKILLVIDGKPGDSYATPSLFALNTSNRSSGLVNIFIHEFAHSFGGLADEYDIPLNAQSYEGFINMSYDYYYKNNVRNFPNIDTVGCQKWCAGYDVNKLIQQNTTCASNTSKSSCESNSCFWFGTKHPVFGTNCVVRSNSMPTGLSVDIGLSCKPNTGCYYGANYGPLAFRSTSLNIMNSYSVDAQFAPPAKEFMSQALSCCYPRNTKSTECKSFFDTWTKKYTRNEGIPESIQQIAFCGTSVPAIANPLTDAVLFQDTIFGFYNYDQPKINDWIAFYNDGNAPPNASIALDKYTEWKCDQYQGSCT